MTDYESVSIVDWIWVEFWKQCGPAPRKAKRSRQAQRARAIDPLQYRQHDEWLLRQGQDDDAVRIRQSREWSRTRSRSDWEGEGEENEGIADEVTVQSR